MEVIRSRDNSKVKLFRSLRVKKNRDKEKLYALEGIKFVREALSLDAEISFIMFDEDALSVPAVMELKERASQVGVPCVTCESRIFAGMTDVVSSQGVAAIVRRPEHSISELKENYRLLVLLDRIQDPGNLGTIIRTADAFGPAAVLLTEGCVDYLSPKVVRATAGAAFRVPVAEGVQGIAVVEQLKTEGWRTVSTIVQSSYSFDDIEYSERICLIIGNEGQGVSEEIQKASDLSITIRMTGNAESLNASVAAGICIYEIRKKLL